MKPFDLKAALEGAKVVTRDGREVLGLHTFEGLVESHPVVGVVEGRLKAWELSGLSMAGYSSTVDLFMAPKKGYVNVWRNLMGFLECSGLAYRTLEDAQKQAERLNNDYLAIGVEVDL